jgi:hypothetical protein
MYWTVCTAATTLLTSYIKEKRAEVRRDKRDVAEKVGKTEEG